MFTRLFIATLSIILYSAQILVIVTTLSSILWLIACLFTVAQPDNLTYVITYSCKSTQSNIILFIANLFSFFLLQIMFLTLFTLQWNVYLFV